MVDHGVTQKQSGHELLKEESQDLSTGVLSTGLFVVHDTVRGSEDQMTELTRWEQVGRQLFDLIQSNIKSWRNNAAFVQATQQVDDDLATSVVIDDLELSNVSVLLHNLQKLDDDLGTWANENL
jgi:hypothetical protein